VLLLLHAETHCLQDLYAALTALLLTRQCPASHVAKLQQSLRTALQKAEDPSSVRHFFWEVVREGCNRMQLDLHEVLALKLHLGSKLITHLAAEARGSTIIDMGWVRVLQRCIERTLKAGHHLQLMKQQQHQPQMHSLHASSMQVACVEVPDYIHLLLPCAQPWAGKVRRMAASCQLRLSHVLYSFSCFQQLDSGLVACCRTCLLEARPSWPEEVSAAGASIQLLLGNLRHWYDQAADCNSHAAAAAAAVLISCRISSCLRSCWWWCCCRTATRCCSGTACSSTQVQRLSGKTSGLTKTCRTTQR
jgi:hypothetical protein